jgi:nicotinate phosphoribosyltransferase
MIISSLLDTDLYKYTMQQAVFHQFPRAHAEYAFKCRSRGADLRPYAEEIRAEIDALGDLRLTAEEADFLRSVRYISGDFVDALTQFRLDPAAVTVTSGDELALTIEGFWYQIILFEVPILAIVNEVYFRNTQPDVARNLSEGRRRLAEKCDQINASPVPLRIMEFGTRRRYSAPWQAEVLETLRDRCGAAIVGTSNVHLARTLGLKPYGTMAHEFLQAGQAFAHARDSQKFMFEAWMQEYRGDLGIALSDVVGMDAFLADFDLLFTKAYDGARHDSGDPLEWGDKLVDHYREYGVDPMTKTAVFSDGLTVPRCIEIATYFEGRIRTLFGVGTNLTNDLGFDPLSIVLKMVRCNGRPVAKISDAPGKTMAVDEVYLAYLRKTFGIPDED